MGAVSERIHVDNYSEGKRPLAQVFYSNAHEVVEQGQYIFDHFGAIPMEDRVREIKEGIKPEFIETIRDPTGDRILH